MLRLFRIFLVLVLIGLVAENVALFLMLRNQFSQSRMMDGKFRMQFDSLQKELQKKALQTPPTP